MAISRIARLYDAFAPALHRFLLSLTGDEADARDLLQDLFLKLARRTGAELEAIRDEQAYLFRSARNLASDLVRSKVRSRQMLENFADESFPGWLLPAPTAQELTAACESAAALQRRAASLLMELPEDQRAVVHLKLWENLTFARIAELLGIPANTAASRYRYAMEKLRQALKPLESARHEP